MATRKQTQKISPEEMQRREKEAGERMTKALNEALQTPAFAEVRQLLADAQAKYQAEHPNED